MMRAAAMTLSRWRASLRCKRTFSASDQWNYQANHRSRVSPPGVRGTLPLFSVPDSLYRSLSTSDGIRVKGTASGGGGGSAGRGRRGPLSSLSPRESASLEERILLAVGKAVRDPILGSDLRTLGWVRGVSLPSSSAALPVDDTRTETKGGERLVVSLQVPTLLHPSLSDLKAGVKRVVVDEVLRALREAGGYIVNDAEMGHRMHVDVQVSASRPMPIIRDVEEQDELIKKLGPGLRNVGQYVAVYSCKGGVGKSTVAVNLAYELARFGGRIGLLDVDIYGPSLPILVKPDNPSVRRSQLGPGMVKPIEHKGVKLMSLGYVSPKSGVPGSGPDGGAAVMRGPMAGRVVTQLLKGTDWGDLDVLVLDLPPGTGDVQLAICQDLELSGAVSVTTPSKLAAVDARKGIEMFTSLGVKTLAAVENMAYFECEGGGKHYPFGKGLKDSGPSGGDGSELKTSNIFQMPISTLLNDANDSGDPLCLGRAENATQELSIFGSIASAISRELLLLQHGRSSSGDNEVAGSGVCISFVGETDKFDVASTHMTIDNDQKAFIVRFFSDTGAKQVRVSGEELRSRHPKTGDKLDGVHHGDSTSYADKTDSMVEHHSHRGIHQQRLFPATVEKKGRYGYAVEWADGATIIYSMLSIAKAAEGKVGD